jgi:hypothetical protein
VSCKRWHRNQRSGFICLNRELKEYYDAHKELGLSSVYPLTASQLEPKSGSGKPLKCKAAECRHLADFAVALAYRHLRGNALRPPFEFRGRLHGQEQVHLTNLVAACEGMAEFQRSVSVVPFDEGKCRNAMYKCLQALVVLHNLWRAGFPQSAHGKLPFHIKRKAHMLQHLCEEKLSMWGSPSRFWSYRDESFIGAVKTIAGNSKKPNMLERRIIDKLLILEHFNTAV